jgi:protein TonB
MTPETAAPRHDDELRETANDRFKTSFGSWFWGSMIAATVLHFALFALFPQLTAEDFSYTPEEMENIDLPPEIDIPPPPEQISRPATPVVTEANIDEDITISPTTFEDNPVENLPPPPEEGEGELSDQPVFTPFEVAPQVTNASEVQRALMQNYPPLLRDAGIGGTVNVWFFIDENGRVQESQVNQSSGHPQLDQAALDVAEVYRFTPAKNREEPVPVWVSIPIRFEVR